MFDRHNDWVDIGINEMSTHISEVTHVEDDVYEEYCMKCGRFVIRNYITGEKTEIERGDITAIHTGGIGLQMSVTINENE